MISIIVPIYNAQAFLEPCIASIVSQGSCDFELLLLDDGSTDESLAICQAYAHKDARVHCCHQDNAGVSATRNRGLDMAAGEWLMFVDADDLLLPNALQSMLTLAKQHAADCVLGGTVKGMGTAPTAWPKDEVKTGVAALPLCLADPTRRLTCHATLVSAGAVGALRFSESLHYAEDSEFLIRVLSRCQTVVLSDQPFYRYLLHPQSAVHRFCASQQAEYIKTLQAVQAYADKLDPSVREALPLFSLSQFLLILVHGIFHPNNPAAFHARLAQARALRSDPFFADCFRKAKLSALPTAKRVTLWLAKHRLLLLVYGIVKLRQKQNAALEG
ncbi:MAG: glycosyltransferase [Clostridia bacterium]